MDDATLCACLEQIRAGDDRAAKQLWDHFYRPMLHSARRWVRYFGDVTPADDEDIVQEAFTVMFRRLRRGDHKDAASTEAVCCLLKKLVFHAAGHWARHARCQKRGGGKVLEDASIGVNWGGGEKLGKMITIPPRRSKT